MRRRWAIVLGLLAFVFGFSLWQYYFGGDDHPSQPPEIADSNFAKIYPPMQCDLPAIAFPRLRPASEVTLRDEDLVAGVVENGVAHAYLLESMSASPAKHIVVNELGETTIAVTHCDRTNRTRVFELEAPDQVSQIRCTGWSELQDMRVSVNGTTYLHQSEEIPLKEHPTTITTWAKWVEAHPTTLVYAPNG